MTVQPLENYARPREWAGLGLVDTDVHVNLNSLRDLFPYLEARWRDYVTESGMGGLPSDLYPSNAPNLFLDGSRPEQGLPGSSLEHLRRQLLDPWEVQYAILNCTYAIDSIHNDDLAAAFARALNRWQLHEWLEQDPRLRGSAVLPLQNPAFAAKEVEWAAEHSQFVQVTVPSRTREPLGRRGFWPIYAAAQRAGLVVGVQAGGLSGNPVSPVGWPTYFVEDYVNVPLAFQTQLMSFVAEGVFVEFPDLKVATIEGGFAWLPPMMWRFDKDWKGLRREVPWVDRPPSEVIREHVRMTIAPLDRPESPQYVVDVIEQLLCDDLLMFSTDYPHAHFTDAAEALPQGISAQLRTKIMSGNAHATYRLG